MPATDYRNTRPGRARNIRGIFAAVLVLLSIGLVSCGSGQKEDTVGNKPPDQLAVELNNLADSIVRIHGGDWTYNNGGAWQPEATEGYRGTHCGDIPDAERFSQSLLGPPVESPEAAVKKVKERFLDKGFTVTNKFESAVDNNRYIVFSMAAENGASFVYQPGTGASGLGVESECSTHPDMDKTTK